MRKFKLLELLKRKRNKLPPIGPDFRPEGYFVLVNNIIVRHEKYWSAARKQANKLGGTMVRADNRKLYKKKGA